MNRKPVQVALAILYCQEKFLFQLRDDIPGILYPGHWGLFGGHLEALETPEQGLKREVLEEINYNVEQVNKFGIYADERIIRHIYYAPLTTTIDLLILGEGFDMALLTSSDILNGYAYSRAAAENRPIGDIHRTILLDFITQQLIK